jgi:CHAT domain-containing protein
MYQWLLAPLEETLQAYGVDNSVFLMGMGLRSIPPAADGKGFIVEGYRSDDLFQPHTACIWFFRITNEQLQVTKTKSEALRQAQLAMIRREVRIESGSLVTSGQHITLSEQTSSSNHLNLTTARPVSPWQVTLGKPGVNQQKPL